MAEVFLNFDRLRPWAEAGLLSSLSCRSILLPTTLSTTHNMSSLELLEKKKKQQQPRGRRSKDSYRATLRSLLASQDSADNTTHVAQDNDDDDSHANSVVDITSDPRVIGIVPAVASDNTMLILQDKCNDEDRPRTIMSLLTGIVAGLTVGTALAAMFIQDTIVCYITFTISLILGPRIVLQRRQINSLPTLQQEVNIFRNHVNRLLRERQQLRQHCQLLKRRLDGLENVQDHLETTAAVSGTDLTYMNKLVYEYGATQRQITRLLQARDLQHLFQQILSCDSDNDNQLSPTELDQLLLRLQAFHSLPSITNPEALRRAFQRVSSLKNNNSSNLRQSTSISALCCAMNDKGSEPQPEAGHKPLQPSGILSFSFEKSRDENDKDDNNNDDESSKASYAYVRCVD